MKKIITLFSVPLLILSCNSADQTNKASSAASSPIEGTWKLQTGTLIEKNDTTVTDYTKTQDFIKVINDSHFAFLGHDLNKGKKADSSFTAGGGTYLLKDSAYTERLEYCNDRQWEGNEFHFTVSIHGDTLTQTGIEKIDSLGINRLNIERYIKMKKAD